MKTLNSLFGLKRILGILLSLGLLIGLIAPSVPAMAAGEQVQIYPGTPAISVAATVGTPVDVLVKIDNTVPLAGYGFSVNYDHTKLTFVSVDNGTFLPTIAGQTSFMPPDILTDANQLGSIACSYLNSNTSAAGTNATLLTLHFTVATSAYAVTNITFVDAANSGAGGATVTTGFTPATVTIGTPPPAAPTVTGFTPASGAAGTLVTITGTNFSGVTGVSFGTFAADGYTVVDGTHITAYSPATFTSTSGAPINVVTSHGSGASTALYSYVDQPTVISFTPTSGFSGQTVTITGAGFINSAANTVVTFGGTAATNVVINSTHSITATLGAGATGSVSVTVTGHGTAATLAGFTYIAASISGFTPATGYTGSLVTITGTGFTGTTGAAGVKFGTANAQSYTVMSDTQIIAVVGNGVTGKVSVTSPSGTIQSATNFTYVQVKFFVNPPSQALTANGTFSVALTINTNGSKQIRGWQTDIAFDPAKIQLDSITEGAFLSTFATANGATTGSGSAAIDNTAGTVAGLSYTILGAPEAGGPTGNGTLATLNFHTVGNNGTSPINLINNSIYDTNGLAIANLQTVTGTVTINITAVNPQPVDVPVDAGLGAQLTFIPPVPVSGWNLIVSAHNNVQRTLNVFANTPWQVTVADYSATTNGHMTKYDGSSYVTPAVRLANPLTVYSGSNSINLQFGGLLASGVTSGQDPANGGDIRGIMFDQPVTYTDSIVTSPNSYHIVVTFTASSTSY